MSCMKGRAFSDIEQRCMQAPLWIYPSRVSAFATAGRQGRPGSELLGGRILNLTR